MKLYSLVLAGMLVASTSANSVALPTLSDVKNFGTNAQAFVSTKQFAVGSAVGAVVVGLLARYCIKKHFVAKSKVNKQAAAAAAAAK